jgi:hypothetical protein
MNSNEILKYFKNPGLLTDTSLPLFEQMVLDYPWFQPGWILYLKNLKNLNHPEYQSTLDRVALLVTDRKWLKNFIEGHSQKEKSDLIPFDHSPEISDYPIDDPESGQSPISDKTKLIENFLASGATFNAHSTQEQENQSVDLAEKAVAISDGIITEKFANLLLSQSKFEEAIESFQKLSLKFPEKSIYFATRIEEIKNLVNRNSI